MKIELVRIVERAPEGLQGSGTAAVDVAFLLPGCKRAREVRFLVRIEGEVLVNEAAPIPLNIPRKLRDRLGEAGWEQLRAESCRLFLDAGGPALIAKASAEHEAREHQRKVRQAANSLKYITETLLNLGVSIQAIEGMVREVLAKKVMEA